MNSKPLFILTLQDTNFYDPIKGDQLKILGQDIAYLLSSRILKMLGPDSKIAIFAPSTVHKSFDDTVLPKSILLIKREERSFLQCIKYISRHDFSENILNLAWINARYLNLDFQDIVNSLEYKAKSQLDLVFSSDSESTLIADNKGCSLNLTAENVDSQIPFFDRSNLTKMYNFNRKFFVVSKSCADMLYLSKSFSYGFYPSSAGLSFDQLVGIFPEHVIASVFLS